MPTFPYSNHTVLDMKQFESLAWSGASMAWRQTAALGKIVNILKALLRMPPCGDSEPEERIKL